MVDPYPETDRGADNRSQPPGMPRWLKVLGIVALLVVAVAIVVMVLSGADHGPGRHTSEGAYSPWGLLAQATLFGAVS